MREVVMEMCERRECAFDLTFCEGFPPPFALFFWFLSHNGVFWSHVSPPPHCAT